MAGDRHLDEWAERLDLVLFPACLAFIASAFASPVSAWFRIGIAGLLAGWAPLGGVALTGIFKG